MSSRKWALILFFALIGVAILIACSNGGTATSTKAQGSVVNVTLSDPSTCTAPKGPFAAIYVTIVDVQINSSATAGDSDPGWQTAIPNTKGTPQQVDLLGLADNQCFLKTLGSNTQIQPGSYQQIRVILADNNTLPATNACVSPPDVKPAVAYANCVFLDGSNNPQPLLLSSEAKTGIKIPSGQIAGGQFVVPAGQTKDLNIDFNACASIVTQGNGGFRLKPVLHAGEVSTTSSSINGKVVDADTLAAIPGQNIVVALEVKSGDTEEVVRQVNPDASGNFSFCPIDVLPNGGTYDVVVTAMSGDGTVGYATAITTGVVPGTALGTIALAKAGAPVSVTGNVTSQNGANPAAGTAVDASLAAWQKVSLGGSTVNVVIPLAMQSAVVVPVPTESNASCPANTFCKSYTMVLPAANPAVGTFAASGTKYVAGSGEIDYFVNATATVPQSGGTADCSPSSITVGPIVITPGTTPVTAPVIGFTGCQ